MHRSPFVILVIVIISLGASTSAILQVGKARTDTGEKYYPRNKTERQSVFGYSDIRIDLGIKWIRVEGGKFKMGNDNGLSPDESPEHVVSLDPYDISATEVTYEQYDRFCDSTKRSKPKDNGWGRGTQPVISVNWNEAYEYCRWASAMTGMTVRLPTEAEWEFAARGGTKSRGNQFSGGNRIEEVGWYSENSNRRPHAVARMIPNELGIFDMTGNVWEWCADWYGDDYYSVSSAKNPKGPLTGQYHVLRGGSWTSTEQYCHVTTRSALRSDYISVSNGFRVVRNVKELELQRP